MPISPELKFRLVFYFRRKEKFLCTKCICFGCVCFTRYHGKGVHFLLCLLGHRCLVVVGMVAKNLFVVKPLTTVRFSKPEKKFQVLIYLQSYNDLDLVSRSRLGFTDILLTKYIWFGCICITRHHNSGSSLYNLPPIGTSLSCDRERVWPVIVKGCVLWS